MNRTVLQITRKGPDVTYPNRSTDSASRALDRLLGEMYRDQAPRDLESGKAAYYHLLALGLIDTDGYQIRILKGEAA